MASSSSLTQEKKITLKAADGKLIEVEEAVAMEMETVKSFFVDNDNATNDMVVQLQNVSRTPPPPVEEVKAFDALFLENKSNDQLNEMIMVANFLNTKDLLDFLIDATAKLIKDNTVEYDGEFFEIKNDYAPEEEDAEIRAEYNWVFEGLDKD
ncbi:hypothetical protein EZV62_025135 [Acer yangbiense]|uniref:SKP1-like protein n=1 Tax=Acer yangbiense TaxID=1000413 RepID=A0A5C7GX20_9ROSI|nr:hypothetical protein EZV62_025135 [Acer yangbiense]